MEQVDVGWSVREFAGLDLGDAHLNRRLLTMAEAFGAQPSASINQASDDWQATKAAYAFSPIRPSSPATYCFRISSALWSVWPPSHSFWRSRTPAI
jgi:hypothetical protein